MANNDDLYQEQLAEVDVLAQQIDLLIQRRAELAGQVTSLKEEKEHLQTEKKELEVEIEGMVRRRGEHHGILMKKLTEAQKRLEEAVK